jgi:antitoxin HicB
VIYPAKLEPDDNDTLLVTFPDFPEGATFGADEDEALLQATDALLVVIAGRIDDREDIPLPSPIAEGLHPVALPALVEAKVLLYRAMREANVRKAALANRLGWYLPQIDRLLDLGHASRLDQIEAAARALGKRLEVTLQ